MIEGEPMMIIHTDVDFKLAYQEIKEAEMDVAIGGFIKPFELEKSPLIRGGLLKIKEDQYLLLVDMHHIISDGVSVNILIKDFMEFYKGAELPKLQIQYKDFVHWQSELRQQGVFGQQENFWLEKFKGEIPILKLATDFPRPPEQSFEGDTITIEVDESLASDLKKLAYEKGVTLYMVLLAGYNILLNQYTRQKDIIVGTPVAGRRHPDLEKIIGMFVNTLPLRNVMEEHQTIEEFLIEVKKNTLEAFENQDYQFDDLVGKLALKRDFSRNPLFDTIFVLQNMDRSEVLLDGMTFETYDYYNKVAKVDLTIYITEVNNELKIEGEYATKLFRKDRIMTMLNHFIRLLT